MQDFVRRVLLLQLLTDPLISLLEAGHFYTLQQIPTFFSDPTWKAIQTVVGHSSYSQYMPIWDNPGYPELSKLEVFNHYKQAVVKNLCK